MTQKDRKEQDNPDENINPFSRSSLAYRNLFQPDPENLPDVSVIPSGMVHALTSLRTYGFQFAGLIEQVRARQRWYVERQIERDYIKREWIPPDKDAGEENGHWLTYETRTKAEREELIKTEMAIIEQTDKIDEASFFVKKLLESYCHISRGRDGKFLEKGKEMAESEFLARNPDNEGEIRAPRRQ